MPDELIDILNSDGKPTGEVRLKSEAHRTGLYHASVHIWFYTKEGHILLQKRAKDKDTYPDLWDVSVAGHIGVGETAINSALREVEEEIGLVVTEEDLEFKGILLAEKQPKPDLFDNEFHHIFISEIHTSLDTLKLQEEEVSEIKLIPIKELQQQVNDIALSRAYVPHGSIYFDFVTNTICEKIKDL
ncbi:NUDIX hydrolase [Aquimarina rubra]|uniref:NUDIX domain-containing protein n=1 Tax=Aquimarina rubra TaxID=1920033 RepID=A0ABW5LJ41_9FLAO